MALTNLEEEPFEGFHKLGEQLKTKKRSLELEHDSLMKRRKKLYSEWVKKDKIFGAGYIYKDFESFIFNLKELLE